MKFYTIFSAILFWPSFFRHEFSNGRWFVGIILWFRKDSGSKNINSGVDYRTKYFKYIVNLFLVLKESVKLDMCTDIIGGSYELKIP